MDVIEGTGLIVGEPNWSSYLKLATEKAAASEHWRAITSEMRGRNTLSPGNAHAIARLVLTYLMHDRAAADAGKTGAVLKPKRGNPKAIARVSPHYTVMKEAAAAAAAMEAELGISPRRRATVGQVERKTARITGADSYLKPRA